MAAKCLICWVGVSARAAHALSWLSCQVSAYSLPQLCTLGGMSMNIQRKNSAHHFRMQSEREQTLSILVWYLTRSVWWSWATCHTMLQAVALCRSGSDKVRSSQDSVKSFIKIIYPEDILISDARLWEKYVKLNYRLINIHTCLVLCVQIPICWEIETFPDNLEAMFFFLSNSN